MFKIFNSLDNMTKKLLTLVSIFIVIGVSVVLLSHFKIVSEERFDNNVSLEALQQQNAEIEKDIKNIEEISEKLTEELLLSKEQINKIYEENKERRSKLREENKNRREAAKNQKDTILRSIVQKKRELSAKRKEKETLNRNITKKEAEILSRKKQEIENEIQAAVESPYSLSLADGSPAVPVADAVEGFTSTKNFSFY